jgi:hypothetical protein
MRVLIFLVTASSAYGPTSSWSSDDIDIVGFLVTGLDPEGIKKIQPCGMDGLRPGFMNRMSINQLLVSKVTQHIIVKGV